MNWNLFNMEIRRNARTLVLWLVIISLLIFLTMSFFRTVAQYQLQIEKMVKIIPMAVIKMRGFSNISDIFSVMGFYAANNIIYMMLLGSIYSIVLTSNILLKEEYGKTAEFLLSQPVTRNQVFYTKLILSVLNILILNIVAAIVSYYAIQIFKTGEFAVRPFLILTAYTLLLNLLFASLGAFISVIIKRARPLTFFCVGLVMVLYFLYSISRITGVDGTFGYISPFKWVNVDVISPAYALEPMRVAGFLGITAFLIVVSGFIYKRKDILT
jgi:ABC-2 type transport system permease protein